MFNEVIKGNKINTSAVTVLHTAATLILAANTKRVRATVQNTDNGNHVFVGGPGVEAEEAPSLKCGTGDFDGLGGIFTFVSQGAIWGIADTASCVVTYAEEVSE